MTILIFSGSTAGVARTAKEGQRRPCQQNGNIFPITGDRNIPPNATSGGILAEPEADVTIAETM